MKRCDYNNGCYETAADNVYIEYDWNVADNLEAEFTVEYVIEGSECELDVCEGCLADIEDNCEEYENSYIQKITRLRPRHANVPYQRSRKGHHTIRQPWTQEEADAWQAKWRKQAKKNGTFVYTWQRQEHYNFVHP